MITKVTPTQFYTWQNYRCSYEIYNQPTTDQADSIPLLLIHPIGVGLSKVFWRRFCQQWCATNHQNPIYNPDLLGCGESDMPRVAYTPDDWAEQLQYFLQNVIKKPVIIVVQGASFPVAIALTQLQTETNLIKGLILGGPPAWKVITGKAKSWQQRLSWNLFDSPLGYAFYGYARTKNFIRSFSIKQLFDHANQVDAQWLDTLTKDAENLDSRHAVFSFLAGFWRDDYGQAIAAINQPTLVVVGETASAISRSGKSDTPDRRLADYEKHLPNGKGVKIVGRNVLPYESTAEFIQAIAPFVDNLSSSGI